MSIPNRVTSINLSTTENQFVLGIVEDDHWYSPLFLRRNKITVNAAQVPTPQTDFPSVINATITDLIGDVNLNASDIRITSKEGVLLDFEIQSFTAATGAVIIWLKNPIIQTGTDVYIYYKNSIATDKQNIKGVWTNGYLAVYHMSESGVPIDSTGNFALTQIGAATSNAAGQIGQAKNFTATATPSMYRTPHIPPFGDNITVSAWATKGLNGENRAIIAQRYEATANSIQFALFQYLGSFMPGAFIFTNPSASHIASTTEAIGSTIHYWTGTYDKTNLKIYIDSVLKDTEPTTVSLPDNPLGYNIGHKWDQETVQAAQWQGIIDEVRIQSVARLQDWITAEYNNQKAPASFYTIAAQESYVEPVIEKAILVSLLVPFAPTGLSASVTALNTIFLSWTAPTNTGTSGILGYKIERKIGIGAWTVVTPNTGTGNTTYSDTTVASGTTYKHRVSAINSTGDGTTSDPSTPQTTPPFGWLDFDYKIRVPITINAGQVPNPVTDFPVQIDSVVAGFANNFETDARDIRFGNFSGSELPYGLEAHNSTTGYVSAHVNLPTIDVATKFFMYCKNSGAIDNQNFPDVWSANTDYSAIFNEGTIAAGATIKDKTTSPADAVVVGATGMIDESTSLIGKGLVFGTPSFSFANVPSNTKLNYGGLLTFECRIKRTGTESFPIIFNKGSLVNTHITFFINGSATHQFQMNYIAQAASGTQTVTTSGSALNNDVEHYLVVTYDGTNIRMYVNGIANTVKLDARQLDALGSTTSIIGEVPGAGGEWGPDNSMYMIRISKAVRSADYITTAQNNRTTSSFYTVGAIETI